MWMGVVCEGCSVKGASNIFLNVLTSADKLLIKC
jgi:hypothetical protein